MIRRELYSSLWPLHFLVIYASGTSAAADFPPEEFLARGQYHAAAFSLDGKRLLTASRNMAQIWDVKSGKLVRKFEGHEASVHSACFSPDERQILTGAGNAGLFGPDDATARLWDVATGKQLAVFEASGVYVPSAQFSPGGKQLLAVATSTRNEVGTKAELWDVGRQTKQFALSDIVTYSKATRSTETVKFSPSGKKLVGMTSDACEIDVWDASSGALIWSVARPDDSTEENTVSFGSPQFSPDEKLVVAACDDRTVRLWNAETGRYLRGLKGHEGGLVAATFWFAGKNVMTASRDGTARLWETESGRQVKSFEHTGEVRELAISNDGSKMICKWCSPKIAGGTPEDLLEWFATLWDVPRARQVKQFALPLRRHGPYPPIVFTPDGRQFLMEIELQQVALFDARTGEVVRAYKQPFLRLSGDIGEQREMRLNHRAPALAGLWQPSEICGRSVSWVIPSPFVRDCM